jgi:hypothetical protein
MIMTLGTQRKKMRIIKIKVASKQSLEWGEHIILVYAQLYKLRLVADLNVERYRSDAEMELYLIEIM